MSKQLVSKMKMVLTILLAVFLVVSVTAVAAGADDGNSKSLTPTAENAACGNLSRNIPRITTDEIPLQKLTLEKLN